MKIEKIVEHLEGMVPGYKLDTKGMCRGYGRDTNLQIKSEVLDLILAYVEVSRQHSLKEAIIRPWNMYRV